MRRAPLIWAGGLAASLAVHAGAAGALIWVTRPGEMPDQPTPETRLEMAAYQVERTEAPETAPDSEQAASGDTSGAAMDAGTIAQSRASAQSPPAQVAAPADTGGAALEPARPQASPVAALAAPATTAAPVEDDSAPAAPQKLTAVNAAALAAPSVSLAAARADPAQVAAAVLPAVLATPAATPAPTRIASATPAAPTLASAAPLAASLASVDPAPVPAAPMTPAALPVIPDAPSADPARTQELTAVNAGRVTPAAQPAVRTEPDPTPATQRRPDAPAAATVAPDVTRTKAVLAFAGSGGGPVDPVSLAAFQSFMAPGDLGDAAAEVRDGIAGLLSAVPCSRLQVQFRPEDNSLALTGHVPEDGLRAPVLAALQAQMGADIAVRDNLLILPSPQCGALTGIAAVGLAESTDQITNPLLVGENTHAREFRYTDGQALEMMLQGADYPAYVYVDYFDADGNVIHLSPNQYVPLERTEPKADLKIGRERPPEPGEDGLYIEIGAPYGQEIAVAFAASEPLYDGLRPLVEPADVYLAWMKERVAEARARHPDFKGEWVYFFVSTAAE